MTTQLTKPGQTIPDSDDTPPKPFGGGAAARPLTSRERKDAQEPANDNWRCPANDNRPGGRDIRFEMEERLWLARPVADWFTGKPILDGKSRKNARDPIAYLAIDVSIAIGAVTAIAITVTTSWAAATLVVPPAWLILTGRLRKMQTLLGHEASHENFFPRGDHRRGKGGGRFLGLSLNDAMGEIATTIALSPGVEDYRRIHDDHHDLTKYTTILDPDTTEAMALKHWPWTLLDPMAYFHDFGRRLRSNLFAKSWGKRVMSWIWVSLLLAMSQIMPLAAWIAAVAIPWVILFRISGALQILSLHAWRLPRSASYQEYADRTWGRFNGIPLPPRDLRGLNWWCSWAAWWAEILFLELPFRIGVLSPDLQAHDVHHLEWILVYDLKRLPSFVDDWRNQPFRRAEVIRDSGDPLDMRAREIWGVRAMWWIARQNLTRLKQAA